MSTVHIPWLTISGRGSHIKATPKELFIERGNKIQKYPLNEIGHLIIIGMHTLQTSTVVQLLRSGSAISFFDSDYTPLGHIYPNNYTAEEEMRSVQKKTPTHKYAITLAKASMKARLLYLEKSAEQQNWDLFYEGELDILHKALDEIEYLIKMDEVRRLYKLSSDMYYEILARSIPPCLGFKRRSERPHRDPVNAMFSFGYAILNGVCRIAVIGAHLDPDRGFLHEGAGSLVYDLIEPLKPRMVDQLIFGLVSSGISPEDYEIGSARCHLSEKITNQIATLLRRTIVQGELDAYILGLKSSMINNQDFTVIF